MKQRCTRLGILFLAMAGATHAASTIFAGLEQGPFISNDGGSTWQVIPATATSPLLSIQPRLWAVAVDPKNSSLWYASGQSGGTSGFFKSTTRGQTWTGVPLIGFQPKAGPGTIAVDPGLTNVIYLVASSSPGGDGFIVKSTDSGATWTKLKLPVTTRFSANTFPDGASTGAIAIDPNTSGVLFAVASNYVFKSVDFGATWKILSTGVDTPEAANDRGGIDVGFPNLMRLDVDSRDSRVLYASAQGTSRDPRCKSTAAGGQCGLYKSVDSGRTWTALNLPAPSASSLSIDPCTGVIYVGASVSGLGGAIMKSADGGNTWVPLKNGFMDAIHGPFVLVDPSTPSVVYAIDYPGALHIYFYRSSDGGSTWTEIRMPSLCGDATCRNQNLTPSILDMVVAPSATRIVNGASFQACIVPNSWATIFGSDFTPAADDWSESIQNGRFPTTLDGVSVTIGGKPAYPYYVSPNQLNVLVPDIGLGQVSVTVTASNGTQSTFPVVAIQ